MRVLAFASSSRVAVSKRKDFGLSDDAALHAAPHSLDCELASSARRILI